MKNIRLKEAEVLDEFKKIVVEANSTQHQVPVVFANEEKVQALTVSGGETARLPVIGLHTTVVGRSQLTIEGVIYTLWRDDMIKIIEQLYSLPGLNKLVISDVTISDGAISPRKSGINVTKGIFTVEVKD